MWLCWRLQLRKGSITKKWGLEKGFRIYMIGSFLLFGGRFLSLLLLAIADHDSVSMSLLVRALVAAPVLLLGGYAMFSVKTYFGFRRAAGIDHFDPAYRSKPFVRQGIMVAQPTEIPHAHGVRMRGVMKSVSACFPLSQESTCHIQPFIPCPFVCRYCWGV